MTVETREGGENKQGYKQGYGFSHDQPRTGQIPA